MDISKARCAECDQPLVVERMTCPTCRISLEGGIEVSALGRLSQEDQIFVTAFVRSHGSIKRMESLFDVSYPTVKNRLSRIAGELDQVFVPEGGSDQSEVLERLAKGELTVQQALKALS